MHHYVKLAADAIYQMARSGELLLPPSPLPPDMQQPSAVFVSIKKHGELRGCTGTILPTKQNMAEEIITNAIYASQNDPRFPPVKADELESLTVSVDVLSTPEQINSLHQHDVKLYGLIVSAGERRGLLLPNLDGVNSAEEQEAICRAKGGISAAEPATYERFKVERYR